MTPPGRDPRTAPVEERGSKARAKPTNAPNPDRCLIGPPPGWPTIAMPEGGDVGAHDTSMVPMCWTWGTSAKPGRGKTAPSLQSYILYVCRVLQYVCMTMSSATASARHRHRSGPTPQRVRVCADCCAATAAERTPQRKPRDESRNRRTTNAGVETESSVCRRCGLPCRFVCGARLCRAPRAPH